MPSRKLLLIFTCFLIFAAGCVPYIASELTKGAEKERAAKIYDKKNYSFDLSSSEKKGTLEIYCRPPSQQAMFSVYLIQVDMGKPLEVYKASDVKIILDHGEHNIKISAKSFGLGTDFQVTIKENEKIVYEYVGPYWIFSSGTLNIAK